MKKAYLVLSVREIRRLLSVARASQRAAGRSTAHCIVLRGLVVKQLPADGELQVLSATFNNAVEKVEDETELFLSCKRVCV